jgi:hypothetical protein
MESLKQVLRIKVNALFTVPLLPDDHAEMTGRDQEPALPPLPMRVIVGH